jgi:MFS family permease
MFVAAAMFLLSPGIPGFAWFVTALVLILSIAQSFYMCSNSAEMMALARPGNKTMASALCQTYTGFGMAAGRNLTSAVLAIGFLTPHWTLGGMSFNHYQTIYLVCAVFAAIIFILLPIMPSVISKHDDYYEP